MESPVKTNRSEICPHKCQIMSFTALISHWLPAAVCNSVLTVLIFLDTAVYKCSLLFLDEVVQACVRALASLSPSMLLALLQLPQLPLLALTLPDELPESEPDSHTPPPRRSVAHFRRVRAGHTPAGHQQSQWDWCCEKCWVNKAGEQCDCRPTVLFEGALGVLSRLWCFWLGAVAAAVPVAGSTDVTVPWFPVRFFLPLWHHYDIVLRSTTTAITKKLI